MLCCEAPPALPSPNAIALATSLRMRMQAPVLFRGVAASIPADSILVSAHGGARRGGVCTQALWDPPPIHKQTAVHPHRGYQMALA